jgi:hypothetical protein
MRTSLRTSTLAFALLGTAAFLAPPSFAVEPDVDSPAGPELPAPRTDRPDFQQDDQTGAVIDPEAEGAQPRNPPDVVIVDPEAPPDAVIVPE